MPRATVAKVRDYLSAEIDRAHRDLLKKDWQCIAVRIGDQGEIATYPCRLVLPFHYPATLTELEGKERDHLKFPSNKWELRCETVQEFADHYEIWSELEDEADRLRVSGINLRRRIAVLREACELFDPTLTIFGLESDDLSWWEVNCFHISGPRLPPPPPPISDIQLLCRLRRQTINYIGITAFDFENDVITAIDLDGAETTDKTIDLLRGIPNLRKLLKGLKRMSLQHTLVTKRSLKFLARELPHVKVEYSHYLDQE